MSWWMDIRNDLSIALTCRMNELKSALSSFRKAKDDMSELTLDPKQDAEKIKRLIMSKKSLDDVINDMDKEMPEA